MLTAQLATLLGVGIVAHIGNKVLVKVHQPDLAQYLDIVIYVGTSIWILKIVWNFFNLVTSTFGWFL